MAILKGKGLTSLRRAISLLSAFFWAELVINLTLDAYLEMQSISHFIGAHLYIWGILPEETVVKTECTPYD